MEEDGHTVKFQIYLSPTDRQTKRGGKHELGKPATKLDQRRFIDVGTGTFLRGVRLQRFTKLQHGI